MLRVCFPFVGNSIGGSHLSALELIRHLPAYEIYPFVVLHKEGPLADFLQQAGVRFTLLPWTEFAQGKRATYAADKLNIKAAQSRFAECLQVNRIDVVHGNDTQIGCTWMGSAALGGARFVWHQRTPGGKYLFNHFAAKADRILCPSTLIRERVLESMNRGLFGFNFRGRRILRVNNPISLDRYSARAFQPLADTKGYPRVGFVANAWSRKRPEIFLAAAARVSDAFPDARFLLAGSFGDEARRELLANLAAPVAERVQFLGFVEDRRALYQRLDVLMVPAVNEGFGRTLVEAMLVGVAVVAADWVVTAKPSSMGTLGYWSRPMMSRLLRRQSANWPGTPTIGDASSWPQRKRLALTMTHEL